MAGLGYKDFTAGAVLTAAQVDGYLMEQAVMNFAGTAARGSALSSVQSAGMMAHVGGGTVTVYDGSAWQQVYPASAGLTFVAGTAFSAASAVNINNCFTSTYDNYKIVVDTTAASTALNILMRLRVSGADNSGANYNRQNMTANSTTVSAVAANGTTSWQLFSTDATAAPANTVNIEMVSPALARTTRMTNTSFFYSTAGASFLNLDAYLFNLTTVFDGFSLLTSTGTISGTVRIYGYRNS